MSITFFTPGLIFFYFYQSFCIIQYIIYLKPIEISTPFVFNDKPEGVAQLHCIEYYHMEFTTLISTFHTPLYHTKSKWTIVVYRVESNPKDELVLGNMKSLSLSLSLHHFLRILPAL